MGRIIGLSLWWLVLGVATVIIERLLDDVPTLPLAVAATFLACIALPLMFWPASKDRKKRRFSDFDMPILAAIEHMMQTVTHSWDSPDKAERFFFRAIHAQMCAGRLRVIGAEAPGGPLRRIRKKELAGLTPVPMNVPPSDTAPHGVRFDLIDEARLGGPDKHKGPLPGFFDLRVRSKDLYRLWPRTRSQDRREVNLMQQEN